MNISIHAPRTGSDGNLTRDPQLRSVFQSTLPARGATWWKKTSSATSRHFNPRSPHGERRRHGRKRKGLCAFQSTLPARGATAYCDQQRKTLAISIHAPRTGSDGCGLSRYRRHVEYFNPRSPHGERPLPSFSFPGGAAYFNPRSPHGERPPAVPCSASGYNFNPRSPHGERRGLPSR